MNINIEKIEKNSLERNYNRKNFIGIKNNKIILYLNFTKILRKIFNAQN